MFSNLKDLYTALSIQAKVVLHFIVNIGGNTAILAIVPNEWKVYVLLVFNLAQVLLAFLDPSYSIHLAQRPAPDRQ